MSANAIEFITIRGFKSFKSVENLKLNPINILIGANGSGKSNFLAVFEFLQATVRDSPHPLVAKWGGVDAVLHFGRKTTNELRVRLGGRDFIEFHFVPTNDGSLTGGWQGNVLWRDVRIFHLNDTGPSSPLTTTANLDDNRFLRSDGSNLAAYLYFLKVRHPSEYRLILRTVQLVAPFLDDFLLEPRNVAPDFIRLEWRHKNSDQYFDVSSLSDGTLRFIVLATLMLQPAELRPSIILIDEPELGLHPHAITLLASLIKQAAVDTQVIVSTQSPRLVDHFEPEDILVAERVNGATTLRRLEREPLKAWLEDYSLGELWEKNEFGGRPRPESVDAPASSR